MFGTIRKHQTWLWVVIATITIGSFVIFGPTNTKMGNALSGDERLGKLDGHAITQVQYQDAIREVEMEYMFRNEALPDVSSPAVQRDAYLKLFLAKKAKDFGIQISTAAVASRIRQTFGEVPLDTVVDRLLKPNGLTITDLDRFFRHQLAVEQLGQTAGLSGKLVTPQEAQTMYRLENQELDMSVAYFSASNYLSNVPVTTENVRKFYTNQLANYRLPDEVQVDYVKFEVTNYNAAAKASMTNLEDLVKANVEHMGTNLFHDTKTPEESKNAVRQEILHRGALTAARKAAGEFAEAVDHIQPRSVDNLKLVASTNKLVVHTTAPFERQYGPTEFIAPPGFAQKAFGLDTNDLFAGPIVGDDGDYVIGLKQRLPSRTPGFAEIEPKVSADYRYTFALQMAQQNAMELQTKLTNAANSSKSFTAICAEAGVKPKSLPPFSVSTQTVPDVFENNVDINMLKQIAFNTPVGKAGPAAQSRDGAFILYVNKQLPFDDSKMKKDLPGFTAYLRSARQNDAFNQWFNQQIRLDPEFSDSIQRVIQKSQSQTPTASRRPRS